MKVKDVYQIINGYAPYDLQESYDNSGLNIGDPESEVTAILATVDISYDTIDEAIENGCNLIVAHHPIIFRPLQNLRANEYVSSVVMKAIKNDINVISAHTNMDKADGGINDKLVEAFNVLSAVKKPEVDEYARFCDISKISLAELSNKVSTAIGDNSLRVIGEVNDLVDRFAAVGGAGGGDYNLIDYCIDKGYVLITAEIKHHLARMIQDRGGKAVIAGHFTTERFFVNIINNLFADKIDVVISKQTSPFV